MSATKISFYHVHTISSEHREPFLKTTLQEVPRKGEVVMIPTQETPEGQPFLVCAVIWKMARNSMVRDTEAMNLNAEVLVRDLSNDELRRKMLEDWRDEMSFGKA